jgi:hypothetical protein
MKKGYIKLAIKFNPEITNHIKSTSIKKIKLDTKALQTVINNPVVTLPAVGATGIVIGYYLKDFNRTSEQENYYQFKIDEATGKPYQADIFQKASAMYRAWTIFQNHFAM